MDFEYNSFSQKLKCVVELRQLTVADRFSLLQDLVRDLLLKDESAEAVRPVIIVYLEQSLKDLKRSV